MGCLTFVIASVVKKKNCMVLPTRSFFVENVSQVMQESQYDITVCIDLGQSIIHSTFTIQSSYDRYSMTNCLTRQSWWLSWRGPHFVNELGFVQPCLIYVDDDFILPHVILQLYCILLSKDEVLRTVCLWRNMFHFLICQMHVLFQNRSNQW